MTQAVGIIPEPVEFIASATQISTFELCPRKWAFKWLDGIDVPMSKYADLGLDTHGHLEDWLREAKVPVVRRDAEGKVTAQEEKAVELAHALIPYLPPPQLVTDKRNVELDQLYTLCGVKFNLKVDLFMPTGWGDLPYVFDHKTTGDPTFKWAIPADKMHEDIQASLYGCWALHKTTRDKVRLQWNYVRATRSAKVQPVLADVTGRMVQDRVGKSLESARKMKIISEARVQGMQVPYDARGCAAYGGCPHQSRCNLSPRERGISIVAQATAANRQERTMQGDTDAFLAALKATQGNGAGQQPQPQIGAQAPMIPQQQPVQQPLAPTGYAQQTQQPMLVPQQQAMPMVPQQQVQQPLPMVPQQQAVQQPVYVQQQPLPQMGYAPMVPGVPVSQPAQAFIPPVPGMAPAEEKPKKERGRPALPSKDDPFAYFMGQTISFFLAHSIPAEQAAASAVVYARAFTVEYLKNKP